MNVIFFISFFLLFNKAEVNNPAFSVVYYQNKSEISINHKSYELAKIYYKEEKYFKALSKILPLTEINLEDKELEFKVYLLVGKILKSKNKALGRQVYHLDGSNKLFGDNLKAAYFLNKALKIIEEVSLNEFNEGAKKKTSDSKFAEVYHCLSVHYLDLGKLDSAMVFSKKLIELENLDENVRLFKGKSYTNLGKIYYMQKKFLQAEKMFIKSINQNKALNNYNSVALAYNNLANIYVLNEDFKKAKEYYLEGLKYINNERSPEAIKRKEMIFDNLGWALYNLKDYEAYKFAKQSYDIRDSLKEVSEQAKYKEIEALHDVDIVRQQEQIKVERQERKTWVIGITGILVSLLLLYLVNLYKLRQRSLSLKLSQNELKQQKKLDQLKSQSQVKIINATIDGKETERKQIAEILHDNVSALLSSASMHLQASQKQFENTGVPIELAKTQQIINEASIKIRDLSHNLMSSLLLKFGLEFAVKDLASKFSNSHIKINTAIHNVYRYSEDYEIKIFNIIQELINNILKHSHATNAYIIIEEENDALHIIVKDDGIGFKDKSEEEKGIGINQIKARVHMMDGSFFIESSRGMGTKAIIQVPVVRKDARVHSA